MKSRDDLKKPQVSSSPALRTTIWRPTSSWPTMSTYWSFPTSVQLVFCNLLLIPAEYSVVFGHSKCLARAGAARCAPTLYFANINKSYTARQANKLLGRTGEPFWQRESYDHWVRDEAEHRRIISYIENNPVKAGLVNSPRKYPWSSAKVRENGAAARKTSVEKSFDAAR